MSNALREESRRVNELDKDERVNIASLRKISKTFTFSKKEKTSSYSSFIKLSGNVHFIGVYV